MSKIRIGISIGDLNGIGLETIIKTFKDNRMMDFCTPIIFGSAKVAAFHRKAIALQDFSFNIINRSKHTLMIEAKQRIKASKLNKFVLRIQVCIDAQLAEVISFQGEKAIPYFMKVSASQSKDEKIQQNRFLTEWLESIFISGINPEIRF